MDICSTKANLKNRHLVIQITKSLQRSLISGRPIHDRAPSAARAVISKRAVIAKAADKFLKQRKLLVLVRDDDVGRFEQPRNRDVRVV